MQYDEIYISFYVYENTNFYRKPTARSTVNRNAIDTGNGFNGASATRLFVLRETK
jgi:hypothetical protein